MAAARLAVEREHPAGKVQVAQPDRARSLDPNSDEMSETRTDDNIECHHIGVVPLSDFEPRPTWLKVAIWEIPV